MTQQYVLKAMAANYAHGHKWDHLDGEVCTKAAAEIRALRSALFMCAAHCQGGHSDAGAAAAEAFGVPFPLTMPDLVKAARAEGFNPVGLWPWLFRMKPALFHIKEAKAALAAVRAAA